MARSIRVLDNASGIVELTSRTMLGLYLTRPSAEVNDIILGILGRAQAMYGVELYAFIFMSNHFHILMRAESAKKMARFVAFVKVNISKELGHRHGWEGTMWHGRYHSMPVDDVECERVMSSRFFYIHANGCKEGLVASPLDWPGVTSARALYRGEWTMTGTWFDRTAEYNARVRGNRRAFASVETVRLSPLPLLEGSTPEEQRRYAVETVAEIERQTRERHARNGTSPLGAHNILKQDPLGKPDDFSSTPGPWFHCATRQRVREMRAARAALISAYRHAAERLRKGERDVVFPEGTFPPPAPFVETRAPP